MDEEDDDLVESGPPVSIPEGLPDITTYDDHLYDYPPHVVASFAQHARQVAEHCHQAAEYYSGLAAQWRKEMQQQMEMGHADDTSITTMVLRNIPNNYTRDMCVALIDSVGKGCFKNEYDFVYLPIDFHRDSNRGYMFINFVSVESALAFRETIYDFKDWAIPSTKRAMAEPSKFQGREKLIEHFRNSEVMHENVPSHYKPLLFDTGRVVDFPRPTVPPKPPGRYRKGPGMPSATDSHASNLVGSSGSGAGAPSQA